MRKTLGVSLLVLLLTSSANAGIMPNETPAPPPPQPLSTVEEPIDTAQNPAADGMSSDAADTLTQTVLDLLAALPSLL